MDEFDSYEFDRLQSKLSEMLQDLGETFLSKRSRSMSINSNQEKEFDYEGNVTFN